MATFTDAELVVLGVSRRDMTNLRLRPLIPFGPVDERTALCLAVAVACAWAGVDIADAFILARDAVGLTVEAARAGGVNFVYIARDLNHKHLGVGSNLGVNAAPNAGTSILVVNAAREVDAWRKLVGDTGGDIAPPDLLTSP